MAILSPPIYLSDTQVSERLGLSRQTVQKWRQKRLRGEDAGPPFIKLGKTVRYDAAQLEDWIRSRTIGFVVGSGA